MTENETLRQELQEKEDLLRELTESNDELGRSLTECGGQIDVLRAELTDGRRRFSETEDELEVLKKRLECEETERCFWRWRLGNEDSAYKRCRKINLL